MFTGVGCLNGENRLRDVDQVQLWWRSFDFNLLISCTPSIAANRTNNVGANRLRPHASRLGSVTERGSQEVTVVPCRGMAALLTTPNFPLDESPYAQANLSYSCNTLQSFFVIIRGATSASTRPLSEKVSIQQVARQDSR